MRWKFEKEFQKTVTASAPAGVHIRQSAKHRFRNKIRELTRRNRGRRLANTRNGYLHISKSWILNRTLTDKCIIQMGYDDIFIRYNELYSSY